MNQMRNSKKYAAVSLRTKVKFSKIVERISPCTRRSGTSFAQTQDGVSSQQLGDIAVASNYKSYYADWVIHTAR